MSSRCKEPFSKVLMLNKHVLMLDQFGINCHPYLPQFSSQSFKQRYILSYFIYSNQRSNKSRVIAITDAETWLRTISLCIAVGTVGTNEFCDIMLRE